MNFDGIQDDDTDNRHDESGIVRLSDMFEDVNVSLKVKIECEHGLWLTKTLMVYRIMTQTTDMIRVA